MTQDEQLPKQKETIEELIKKIENLEKEKEQYLENLKRAKNDVLRIQSEFEQKKEEIQETANSQLIYHLISVLDGFDLALEKSKESEIDKGFYLIYSQFKDILQKFGLLEIYPLEQKFDPAFHESISVKKCEKKDCDKKDEDIIIQVFSKGYLYKGRLLRPARVKVINHG